MNLQNQISIRRQLLISFILLAIIPLLFLGLVISCQSIISQKSQMQNWMEELTAQGAKTISFYLAEQEHKLELLINSNYLLGMTSDEQANTLSKFMSASKNDEHDRVFNDIALLNEDGVEMVHVSVSEMVRIASFVDWSDSPEFIEPFRSKKNYHSDIYFDQKTGEPLMKITYPLLDLQTSEVKGVIVAEMKILFMHNIISSVKVGRTGISFLVDETGRIISHPNSSAILKGESFLPPDKPKFIRVMHEGYALVAAKKIKFGKKFFYMVSELPLSEAFAHIPGFLIIIAITMLIAGIGAVALAFLIVRQIVEPVESLSKTVRQITNGDFSLRAEVGSRNEIGGLADDFNVMTDKLLTTMKAYENERNLVTNAIDSLCHPFFIVDAETYQIKLANKASKFGILTPESNCHKLTHHSDDPCSSMEHPCPIREIKKTKMPVVVEHVHYDDEGNPGVYEVHGYPIFNEAGEVFQVIEYVIDVTEKRRFEHNLWKAREAGMAEVAAELMHNIGNAITPAKISGLNIWRRLENNPLRNELAYIMSEFYSLIQSNPAIPEAEKARFSKIANLLPQTILDEFDYVLEEMVKICTKHEHIEHIINLQHKYAQKRGLMVAVNVNNMVEDALQILNDLLTEKAVKVVKELSDLPNIKSEKPKLLEIMISLIKKGLEASMVNPVGCRNLTIATSVDEEKRCVYLDIKDNGAGFKEADKEKLFSFAFDNSEDKAGPELHSIANYVNLIRGSIEAHSEGPGKGTTISIRLPIIPA